MTLPEAMKLARFHAKMRQEDLAAKIGVTRQTIAAIEHGKDSSWSTVREIARTLSISLDSLD